MVRLRAATTCWRVYGALTISLFSFMTGVVARPNGPDSEQHLNLLAPVGPSHKPSIDSSIGRRAECDDNILACITLTHS